MKIRIQDNSIRFRITLKELEIIQAEAGLAKACLLPNGSAFRYSVGVIAGLAESDVVVDEAGITLRLSTEDLSLLADPRQEGVYIKREWQDADGSLQRFMAFIEKDRPATTCKKIEAWIYDGHHAGENTLVAKPARHQ